MPKRSNLRKVLVIGSGPIVIGQGAEFDYAGSQACRALREEGVEVVLVNSNPATIQTDADLVDRVYLEPLVPEIVSQIVRKERPQGLLPTMGGQTGLNLAVELQAQGVLDEVNTQVIGTSVEAIRRAEDRRLFNELLNEIGEPFPRSVEVGNLDQALTMVDDLGGYPVLCRASYSLGGTGSGIAGDREQLARIVSRGLAVSLNHTVALDQCVMGWKEIEYEVMRDAADNCIAICNMENFDPMGIHTGDSIVVAPAQTLTDEEHQTLRAAALKVIRALKIEGGCNIQFAINPRTFEYLVIEVNPRVSRSSALASKATGYPIARVAAKIALGLTLDEIRNDVTAQTPACFEPALDYVVIKMPRWPFDKFAGADRSIGTQMKSTGEVMAMGGTFEEALQKAIRSLDIEVPHLGRSKVGHRKEELMYRLARPSDERIFQIYAALRLGSSLEEIHQATSVDRWFLHKLRNIAEVEARLSQVGGDEASRASILLEAKWFGFSDLHIAHVWGMSEGDVRALRHRLGVLPAFKMVDTCAAEFEAETPYYYSTYSGTDEVAVSTRRKVVILGSGPIRIGQGIEFDYCCVHSSLALKEEGVDAIIINNNPETVSTDYDVSDRLYFEPLTFEEVMNVIEKERPEGVIVQFGGQTSINLAVRLAEAGVPILGTGADDIDIAEDRQRFSQLLTRLGIPQPRGATATSIGEARRVAQELGYPILLRPSYVLGGRAMVVVHDEGELEHYMEDAVQVSQQRPVLVDKFLQDAIEVDVDAVADGRDTFVAGILEHIEMAGVHSGDAAMVLPPQTLSEQALSLIRDYTVRLANALHVIGLMNVQYAVKDDEVFVLEVNPRASRTVPFVSKVIGIPLAKAATRIMLGRTLRDQRLVGEAKMDFVAVKESVFPFTKLPCIDPLLGPEMQSTGEVMGIDVDFGRAYYKAQLAAGNGIATTGRAFLSISRRESRADIVEIGRGLTRLGFGLLATEGTAKALVEANLAAQPVHKVSEGTPNIIDYVRQGAVNLIINTPTGGRNPIRDGYLIRRAAIDFGIPYVTTLAAARAVLQAIQALKTGRVTVAPLNEYRARKARKSEITWPQPQTEILRARERT